MIIAVLGAYGDVGRQATRQLLGLGRGALRLGGRDVAAARDFAAQLPAADLACCAVDYRDRASLRAFVDGARIVVNCAGPSHAIGDAVALEALRTGADYIDVAGDDALHRTLDAEAFARAGRTVVLSCGLQPGLTGLLPRWQAQHAFDEVHRLVSYFAVLDQFTAVAADDYLQGAEEGVSEPLAAWRNGHRRSRASTRVQGVRVPFFPGAATLLPFLDAEGERLARALRLERGDWHTVLVGEQIRRAFDRARTLGRAEAIAALRRASLLDLAGREPYVVLLVQLEGRRGGAPATRTLMVRGHGNAVLTGTMAALGVRAVDEGTVPPGCHFAADVLPPATTVARLRGSGALGAFELFDGALDARTEHEEGSL
ncbi:saccharopine dehydrogenase NADP-binding domain-containing protein [Pendulispora rubella]|uniref:Saccharopine dehydrogenase NADP-binding domain-containing protein n=1 Tax=Pendulispora rubella TaxID=2741070 RepID=A0ABZ2KWH0_9BACT|nr:SrbE [Sorangiineae bacterium]